MQIETILVHHIKKQTMLASLAALAFLSVCSCSQVKRESTTKPWQMGEKVPLGPFTYSVIESDWKTELTGSRGRLDPKQRFLVLKLTVANSARERKALSFLSIRNEKGDEFPELQDVEGVPGWMGFLREIPPGGTDSGIIVFDAPLGHYRLVLNDGGLPGEERISLVDLPLQMLPGQDEARPAGRPEITGR